MEPDTSKKQRHHDFLYLLSKKYKKSGIINIYFSPSIITRSVQTPDHTFPEVLLYGFVARPVYKWGNPYFFPAFS